MWKHLSRRSRWCPRRLQFWNLKYSDLIPNRRGRCTSGCLLIIISLKIKSIIRLYSLLATSKALATKPIKIHLRDKKVTMRLLCSPRDHWYPFQNRPQVLMIDKNRGKRDRKFWHLNRASRIVISTSHWQGKGRLISRNQANQFPSRTKEIPRLSAAIVLTTTLLW